MEFIDKLGKTNLIIAVGLLVVWGIFAGRYYGPADPLSKEEVETHLKNVQNMFMKAGVPDANGGVDLPAIMGEFRKFAEEDDGQPIYMVNMMKWRDKALFRPDLAEYEMAKGMTTEEADLLYNHRLFYELSKNASHTAYLSKAFSNAISYGFTSDEIKNWGEIGIFRYSSRRDFFNMVGSDSYVNAVYLKLASMGNIAIIPTQPHGLLFNPMPNLPVLLAFLFIIGFLVFLLCARCKKD